MAEPKYSSKSKTWTGLVYSHTEPSGKRKYQSITAPTKREWKRLEAEFKANRKGKTAKDMTIGDCVEQYISSKEGVLSPATIATYRNHQKRIRPIDDIRVSVIDSADAQYFVSQLACELKPKTVRNVYTFLKDCIAMVDDDKRFKVTLPATVPIEYNIPTDGQVAQLMDTANDLMRLCIALAAFGTLRRGEICALEYSDVLYDFDAVFIHRSIVKDQHGQWIRKEMPKTSGSVRRVVLSKEVIEMIGYGEGTIVGINPGALTRRFIDLRNKLGFKCRFHDLRHYSASTMHAMGIPDKYIMERGGWTDDKVLKAVYQNVLPDRAKLFTERINDHFSGIMEKIS